MAGRGSPAAFPQTEEVSEDRRKRLMQASSTHNSAPPSALDLSLPLLLSACGLPLESRSAFVFLLGRKMFGVEEADVGSARVMRGKNRGDWTKMEMANRWRTGGERGKSERQGHQRQVLG